VFVLFEIRFFVYLCIVDFYLCYFGTLLFLIITVPLKVKNKCVHIYIRNCSESVIFFFFVSIGNMYSSFFIVVHYVELNRACFVDITYYNYQIIPRRDLNVINTDLLLEL